MRSRAGNSAIDQIEAGAFKYFTCRDSNSNTWPVEMVKLQARFDSFAAQGLERKEAFKDACRELRERAKRFVTPKPQTPNPKPESLNSSPETRISQPQTRNRDLKSET